MAKPIEGKSRPERREFVDRRTLTWNSFISSFYKKRRRIGRRGRQQTPTYYIDLHEPWVLCVVGLTLVLCVVDVYNTLTLLEAGGTEINPFMRALIERDIWMFFGLKYTITAIGLGILVTHRHFSLFRYIRADYMLIAVVVAYIVLIIYEFWLLSKIE